MAKSSWYIIDIARLSPFVNNIFDVFIIISEYANEIIYICNKELIVLCLSFYLVLSSVA